MRFEHTLLELDLRFRLRDWIAPASDVSCAEAACLYVAFALRKGDPAHRTSIQKTVPPRIDVCREAFAGDVGRVSPYTVISVATSHIDSVEPTDDLTVILEGLRKDEFSRVLLLCPPLARCAVRG